jgi:exodeoxyribonuclease V alpha subunit
MTQHYATLQRNLLYTGVTRGKRLVVLVGQKKAIAIAAELVEVGGMAERAGLEA